MLFSLFSDWVKLNHLECQIERGFLDIFLRHIYYVLIETIQMTKYTIKLWCEKMFKEPSSK